MRAGDYTACSRSRGCSESGRSRPRLTGKDASPNRRCPGARRRSRYHAGIWIRSVCQSGGHRRGPPRRRQPPPDGSRAGTPIGRTDARYRAASRPRHSAPRPRPVPTGSRGPRRPSARGSGRGHRPVFVACNLGPSERREHRGKTRVGWVQRMQPTDSSPSRWSCALADPPYVYCDHDRKIS